MLARFCTGKVLHCGTHVSRSCVFINLINTLVLGPFDNDGYASAFCHFPSSVDVYLLQLRCLVHWISGTFIYGSGHISKTFVVKRKTVQHPYVRAMDCINANVGVDDVFI